MRRGFAGAGMRAVAALLTLLLTASLPATARAEGGATPPPAPTAKASILIEARSGRVLEAKNADAELPMASTTKIMTALMVLENATLSDTVEVSANASGVEGSSIYLGKGERLTVEQLLYGLMLKSGNDAAVALAEHVGGSVSGFVEMMNARAAEMGLSHTRFQNPNGLPAQGHYTTARELAAIAREAMTHEAFRTIVSTKKTSIPWDGHEWSRVLKNGNKLLTNYADCIGIKTGFTKKAGRCLVSAAQRGGMTLIAVALNAPDMYGDCQALFEYGFSNYAMRPVVYAGESVGRIVPKDGEGTRIAVMDGFAVPLRDGENVEKRVLLPENVELPVPAGYPVGDMRFYVDGQEVGGVPVCAQERVSSRTIGGAFRRVVEGWMMVKAGG